VRLRVRIGELSGVEPELLSSAYSMWCEGTICDASKLEIVRVPAAWACPECQRPIPRGERLRCASCEVPARLRQGDEIFLDRIEAYYGRKPMIYTTVDFHRDNLEGYFGEYTFWVRSVADHPDNIYNGREWDFWQYTGTGRVPGIEGDTDINVFAGDRKDWKAWVSASAL